MSSEKNSLFPPLTFSLAISFFTLFSACGGNCLRYDEFHAMTLSGQILRYKQARRENCIGENSTAFLGIIATHGYEAADAMVSALQKGKGEFPPDDALRVLEFVHFQGADLREHEALKVLEQIAGDATADNRLREEASEAVQRIRRNDPLFGVSLPVTKKKSPA
jgi:hypothetical protein